MAALARILGRSRSGGEGEGAHWLSVSDLMAGLMMVFLFVAIALMRNAILERDQIREIAVAYRENQVAIYEALVAEFERDLVRWEAEIDQDTLSFEFRGPDVLFPRGETEIPPRFKRVLEEFFPRYLETLKSFKESVNEIRVEGHTSSDWAADPDESAAYFWNMELSQGRTHSVLRYAYDLPVIEDDREWVKQTFAAVGFSSSRLILDAAGQEDPVRSRRVTFRVITNAETQIRRIIGEPQR